MKRVSWSLARSHYGRKPKSGSSSHGGGETQIACPSAGLGASRALAEVVVIHDRRRVEEPRADLAAAGFLVERVGPDRVAGQVSCLDLDRHA